MDNLFLEIERPERQMSVSCLWLFENPLLPSRVIDQLHVLVDNPEFARYRQVPRGRTQWRTPKWEENEGWHVKEHLSVHTLDNGSMRDLQAYLSELASLPLDYEKPLWEMHLVLGLENKGCAIFWKAHHCLADGQGFVWSLLSCTSANEQMNELIAASKQKKQKAPARVLVAEELPGLRYIPRHERIPQWALQAYSAVLFFFWYVSFLLAGLVHGIWIGIKSSFYKRKSLLYDEPQTPKKTIAWSDTVSIDDIRIIRKAYGVTLNDVMMATVTRCIRSYLLEINGLNDPELMLLIPISLRRPSDWTFCNITGGSWAWTPMTDMTTRELVWAIQNEMNAIKGSLAPLFAYNFAQLLYRFPCLIPHSVITEFTNKCHGVLTNIPGPRQDITFAGERILYYTALPPQTGKSTLAIGLFSYSGNISVNIMADNVEHYPDIASKITSKFVEEFGRIMDDAKNDVMLAEQGEDKKSQ